MTATTILPTPPRADPDSFILPRSLESERACLGAALVSAHAADVICDKLGPDEFFRRAHQVMFTGIRALREHGSSVDFVTLRDYLTTVKKLDEVGGPTEIVKMADGVPTSTNVDHYISILKDLSAKRALVAFAQRTIDLVAEATHSAPAILTDSDRRLMELQAGHVEGRMLSLASSASALYQDLEWRVKHRGELTGVHTGFQSINEQTLGWQAGDLIIIAARPSIGKTTFVLNSAIAAAQTLGAHGRAQRFAVFSLEMRRRQLEYRIVSQLSGIPLTRILGGHIGDPDYAKISAALGTMHEMPIEIDDRGGQTVWDMRASCRRLKAEGGLDAVVIDYVQLMPGSLERRGATRNEEITDISRKLKSMADELSVPVLLLSQLSRAASDRVDPRPKLTDLRESGALEQDADIVCFLHRKNHREGGRTEFIIEKARNGPTGTVLLSLDRDITTFTDGCQEAEAPAEEEKPKRARPPAYLFKRR